jgi:ABC-type antimicrobial peptide transport system permease subunit
VSFVIRGTGISAKSVRAAMDAVDPNLTVNDFAPFQQLVSESVMKQRFRALLLTGFASIALFLAGLGVYGVLAYAMSQRAKEMGVRLALGAQPLRLFGLVVKEGMYPVMAGSAIGLAGAVFATRFLQSLLFGVTPGDPMTHAITIGIILAVALVACSLPAMKAVRVDPLVSLREQ